jgi:hypothetical protein
MTTLASANVVHFIRTNQNQPARTTVTNKTAFKPNGKNGLEQNTFKERFPSRTATPLLFQGF